jgi:hypothetical protein
MAEQINLATPDQSVVGTSDYHVILLTLAFEGSEGIPYIFIQLRGSNGLTRSFRYDGTTALNLMIALNKTDLSTKSLQRRILERLIADGKLIGTITGTPD